jgi:hypothetical protein
MSHVRPIRQREIPEAERPLSEQFRLVALAWADADGRVTKQQQRVGRIRQHLNGKLQGTSNCNARQRLAVSIGAATIRSGASW